MSTVETVAKSVVVEGVLVVVVDVVVDGVVGCVTGVVSGSQQPSVVWQVLGSTQVCRDLQNKLSAGPEFEQGVR